MRAMKILTAAQMRRVDRRAERDLGVSSETLMDNAGRAVARALLEVQPGLDRLDPLILCGKGNNGGDGITAARHLKERGVAARVVLLARLSEIGGPAVAHLKRALAAGISVEEVPDEAAWTRARPGLARHRLIVDAVLGTGLNGPARGLAAHVIEAINGAEAVVVALDVPSGLSGDSAGIPGPSVRAHHTIALAFPKLPHVLPPAADLVGLLRVVDIGIPAEAVEAEAVDLNLIDEQEAASFLPPREPDSHKGDYGRLLVVGGSRGKSGAAAMVGLAALRSGAGLVTAASAASAQPILAAQVVEMMTEPLPETRAGALARSAAEPLRALLESNEVLAMGPGLTSGTETAALVREVVATTTLPIVLDADGLNAFAGAAEELKGDARVLILTPHPGEMARLLGPGPDGPATAARVQQDRVGVARAFAIEHACYLVLKGHRSVVAEPGGQVWINPTGNPGMATAGSGDVLTGVLAGLLSQGVPPLEACLLGVYAHGLAGDLAASERGEIAMIARDLIDHLPAAFLRLEEIASEEAPGECPPASS